MLTKSIKFINKLLLTSSNENKTQLIDVRTLLEELRLRRLEEPKHLFTYILEISFYLIICTITCLSLFAITFLSIDKSTFIKIIVSICLLIPLMLGAFDLTTKKLKIYLLSKKVEKSDTDGLIEDVGDLEEAILHCTDIVKATKCERCKLEQLQLKLWLIELKHYRSKVYD